MNFDIPDGKHENLKIKNSDTSKKIFFVVGVLDPAGVQAVRR